MTKTLAKTVNPEVKTWMTIEGRVSSTVSKSRENLLRIRPTGVVSKNDMGLLNIDNSIAECNLADATTDPLASMKKKMSMKTAEMK